MGDTFRDSQSFDRDREGEKHFFVWGSTFNFFEGGWSNNSEKKEKNQREDQHFFGCGAHFFGGRRIFFY